MRRYIVGILFWGIMSSIKSQEVEIPCVAVINNLKEGISHDMTLHVYTVLLSFEEDVTAIEDLDFWFFTEIVQVQPSSKPNICIEKQKATLEDIFFIGDRTIKVNTFLLKHRVDQYKKLGMKLAVGAELRYTVIKEAKNPKKKTKNLDRVSDEITIVSK